MYQRGLLFLRECTPILMNIRIFWRVRKGLQVSEVLSLQAPISFRFLKITSLALGMLSERYSALRSGEVVRFFR